VLIHLIFWISLAKEYQRNDGFSDFPPIPGQLVISLEDDLSDLLLEEGCISTSENISSEDEDSDEDSDCEPCSLTPKKLF